MKKIYLLLITTLLVFIISGCNFIGTTKFTTEEEAEIYAINAMKEKYQIEFIITESVYESEMHKNLIGTMKSIDGRFNDISFQVLNIGGLKDNLSKNYFETPLKLMIDNFMDHQSIENLVSYETNIYIHPTVQKWTGEETLQEYIDVQNPRIEITAHFGSGYNANEYTAQIIDLMKKLCLLDVQKELNSWVLNDFQLDIVIFTDEWQSPNQNRFETLSYSVHSAFERNYMLLISSIMTELKGKSPSIRKYDLSFSSPDEDYMWNIDETKESYIMRNNVQSTISLQMNKGFSYAEYVKTTKEVIDNLSTLNMGKQLIVYIFDGDDIFEIGNFELLKNAPNIDITMIEDQYNSTRYRWE